MNLTNIKSLFPIFAKKINNKNLIYLDSSNSSQKPKLVIDRLNSFYSNEFSNVGRSVHSLAVAATNNYENTRVSVQKYLNAKHKEEIVFTKGETEAINLVFDVIFFSILSKVISPSSLISANSIFTPLDCLKKCQGT